MNSSRTFQQPETFRPNPRAIPIETRPPG